MMRIFLKYFWFIGAVLNVFNSAYLTIQQGKASKEMDKGKVFKLYTFIYVLPLIFLGVFQVLGGYSNPLYLFSNEIELFRLMAWISLMGVFASMLYINNFKSKEEIGLSNSQLPIGDKSIIFNLIILVSIIVFVVGIVSNIYVEMDKMLTMFASTPK